MDNKNNIVSIPQISRDERIGSAFGSLFKIIKESEKIEGEELIWDFKDDLFLHPFF